MYLLFIYKCKPYKRNLHILNGMFILHVNQYSRFVKGNAMEEQHEDRFEKVAPWIATALVCCYFLACLPDALTWFARF